MPPSTRELVTLERAGGIATLTLNDPERANAMSIALAEEFADRVGEIRADPTTRAVIVTGAGRHFAAGGDLAMIESLTAGHHDEARMAQTVAAMRRYYGAFLGVTEVEVPVIAAVNGPAVGAGLCLALACDLRVVADEATLGFTFARLGLHPGLGMTYFLPRLVGRERAFALLTTGRTITGREAVRLGLAIESHPAEQLLEAVRALAGEILIGAPRAIRQIKKSLARTDHETLEECLANEATCQATNFAGPDVLEGLAALRERRRPRFAP